MHPPTVVPPLQVDEGAKGVDADHNGLILAPRANKDFVQKREKRRITLRPLPDSKVFAFSSELTRHRWSEVFNEKDVDKKTEAFHGYIRKLLDKHCPEKSVTVSSLDKPWMTPQLKQLLRQTQRGRLKNGKNGKFKELWSKFRRLKKKQIKSFQKNFVAELRNTNPSKWYKKMKQLSGGNQMTREKLSIRELDGLSDKECAEAVAQSFAAVSQEYEILDRTKLPSFLPAGRPEKVNVFQVLDKIKSIGHTKSTLPLDLPDRLRKECALDLAEPMTDIINSCLLDGRFPKMWRREWVTPVPKAKLVLETCDDVRKVASTSDFSKIFELFLRKWISEDIGHKIDINQFAGRKGAGPEHMLVLMMDRVLSQLDRPGMRAIIKASVDWASAFSRTDPTKTITKFINMGVRASLISILIEFLDSRKMTVKYNSAESSLYTLVGGGPQGSWTGQESFIVSSDDNASFVKQDDRYKYCDDLSILELVLLGDILTEYNFYQHVASDGGVDELYLNPQGLSTQINLDKIATWTEENLMLLRESKTDYLIFTRAQQRFATRFTVNNKFIERKKVSKLLGVWLQEDGGWQTNTTQLCRKAYMRMNMLTKLRYAGLCTEELLHIYKQYVRTTLEYCSVVFHSSLTTQQSNSLERCQAVSLRVILQESYVSYSAALEMSGLDRLSDRRLARCLDFSVKCTNDTSNSRFFPRNTNLGNYPDTRRGEQFKVNFGRTKQYKESAIPFCQRLLNEHCPAMEEGRRAGQGEGGQEGGGQEGGEQGWIVWTNI